MQLNIVHLNKSLFNVDSVEYNESVRRERSFLFEMSEQLAKYKVWDAIYNEKDGKTGCAQSHKNIVRWAKQSGLKMVAIAEDDIVFTNKGAFDFFIKSIPNDFDMYLGVSYSFSRHKYIDGVVTNYFDSLTLYVVHERFYDDFLSVPDNVHLDCSLSDFIGKKAILISDPYVCKQTDGYSFNQKKIVENEWRLEGKDFF
jgi:hypothetical protein